MLGLRTRVDFVQHANQVWVQTWFFELSWLVLDPFQILKLGNLTIDLLVRLHLDDGRALWHLDFNERVIVVSVAQVLSVLGADRPVAIVLVLVIQFILVLRDVCSQHLVLNMVLLRPRMHLCHSEVV